MEELDDSNKAISMLGGMIGSTERFSLTGNDYNRTLIKIDKVEHTSEKYPRRVGVPAKKPII